MKLMLIGQRQGTHIGGGLERAALALGHDCQLLDTRQADAPSRWQTALWWRLDRRPARLAAFSRLVGERCSEFRPDLVLCTGQSPLNQEAHDALDALSIPRRVWLTDDPFNPAHRARWFLKTLLRYHQVFSPRLANLAELKAAGAKNLSYLPFGYDPDLFFVEPPASEESGAAPAEILFVGGADADRAPILRALAAQGFALALYGGYWQRFGLPTVAVRGLAGPAEIRRATATARISLCLVRRANRDGHVMRSYEIPACGGVPLVEDTAEHRTLFGPPEESALYFQTEADLVAQAKRLLADAALRQRLAEAATARIATPQNTYAHRLQQMIG